ncbi:MAG: diphthine synthase [Candidatus Pacearchaeota archaeon]
MLYIIGLGLDLKDISLRALEAIKKCDKVYLETYTTTLPYKISELEKLIKRDLISLDRDTVESDFLIKEAKRQDIVLLVYGDPLAATTHIALVREAKKEKVKFQVIHNTSILNVISDTGLSLYKFGKTTSLPRWQENYKPTSFFQIIKENLSIGAHTLLLIDPGLSLREALQELIEVDKSNELTGKDIIVASQLGTSEQTVFLGKIKQLINKEIKIKEPFCLIVPAELGIGEEFLH